MRNRVFSGLDQLPRGRASDRITEGCIVLEGGAFRGVYGEGVLDALMEADINMQCTIGVSAGAMNGVNYVSGQIGRSARVNLKYRHDSRYVGWRALRNNRGIIGFDFAYGDEVNTYEPLDYERFCREDRRFVAVAANCLTGKPAYFERGSCGDIFQAVRASASMPFLSKMVNVDGVPHLDGGCCCKIPYRWALDQGFRRIVVVRTRPGSYRKKTGKGANHMLTKAFYHSYPNFSRVLSRSNEDYNRQCEELEALHRAGRVFVLSPSGPVDVGRLEGDLEKLGRLYYMGYEDTKRQLEALRTYLQASQRHGVR